MIQRILMGSVLVAIGVVSQLASQPASPAASQLRPLTGDELVDLPDNECDLLAYLTQLAQLRGDRGGPVVALAAPGSIVGTIVRQGTSEPIAGAMVTDGSNRTVTDISGHFTLANVTPGTRTVVAQLEGWFGPRRCGSSAMSVGSQVDVVSRQTANITMALIPGAAISGKVFNAMGTPESDAPVQVYRRAYQDGSAYFQQVSSKTTDDHGYYRIYHLPPGEYAVAAGPRSQPANRIDAASNIMEVKTFYGDTTDSARSTWIAIKGGEENTGADISMQTGRAVSVSGQIFSELPEVVQITGPGGQTRELRNATATLTFVAQDKNALTEFKSNVSVSMMAPNFGRFEIRNVPPGTYDLLGSLTDPTGFGTQNPPGKATGPLGFGRATVDVHGDDIERVAVRVHAGTDVNGRITIDGGTLGAQNVRIALQPDDSASTNGAYRQVGQFRPVVDDNGSFTIPSVPEGRYRFQLTYAKPGDLFIEDIRQGSVSVYDNGMYIGAPSSGDVHVILRTGTGSIRGTVIGEDGKPAVSAMVVAVPSKDHRQNLALYRSTTSDGTGRFSWIGIPPGDYDLFSWEDFIPGAFQNADYLDKYAGRGVKVTVSRAAGTTAEVHMIPAEMR